MSVSKYLNDRYWSLKPSTWTSLSYSTPTRDYSDYRYSHSYVYSRKPQHYSPSSHNYRLPSTSYIQTTPTLATSNYNTSYSRWSRPSETRYTPSETRYTPSETRYTPSSYQKENTDKNVSKLTTRINLKPTEGAGWRRPGSRQSLKVETKRNGDKDYKPSTHQNDYSSYNRNSDKRVTKPEPSKASITGINMCVPENSRAHHTDSYEMCQEGHIDDLTNKRSPAKLVLRRGQEFKVKVLLDSPYKNVGQFRVTSSIGEAPLRSKGTLNEMLTAGAAYDGGWWAKILSVHQNEVDLSIFIPTKCAVGEWKFLIDMVPKSEDGKAVGPAMCNAMKFRAYILFNAWCKGDAVYMENARWRDEYVLNDTGKLYTGNYKQIFGMPWNFGQFESVSLQATVYVLDKLAKIPMTYRGNPIAITRMLSALVNSLDDNGILTGRWDGEYSDGISPTKWNGSVAILQKYMETKQPVEYGQCWVFSGVMTTVCRALGIPTRSVTNFASAHDTDGSLTIDMHWDENGEHMSELDTDSVWNFHVWNECWMTRPDLQKGYGGWQAVDATPQETSEGIFCSGPASVNAIKNGDVGILYDTPFIFAEVNADRVNWFKQKHGPARKTFERDVVGRNISTKAVGVSRDFSARGSTVDREDITHAYKYDEGSTMERAAVWRASHFSTKPDVYTEEDSVEDVFFSIKDFEEVYFGSSFEIPIEIRNTSDECRTISLTVTLLSVYYTGVRKSKLLHKVFNQQLSPHCKKVVTMNVEVDDYLADMKDHNYAMKINYLGSVRETKQIFASQDDFRLRTLVPDVIPSKTRVSVGEVFSVKMSFANPLSMPLTDCVFSFEAAGNLKPVDLKRRRVGVGCMAEIEVEVTAKRAGDCVVISSFECKEMGDIQGQCTVTVQPCR